jgi:flavorubredoxin
LTLATILIVAVQPALKADLKLIVEAHAHLTEADLERGIQSMLRRPPQISTTVNELWDRFLPHWHIATHRCHAMRTRTGNSWHD